MDYENVLKFSFDWLFSKESIKYSLIYYAISIAITLLFAFIIFSLAMAFFGPIVSQFLSDPAKLAADFLANQTQFVANLSSTVFGFVAALIPIILIFLLVNWIIGNYLWALFVLFSLRKASLPTTELNAMLVLRLMALDIVSFFWALFSVFKPVFLLVLAAGIVLIIAGIFLPILLIFGFLLLLVYLVIFIYNLIRLYFATNILLSTNAGVFDSVKQSWLLTDKKVLEIILAGIICGIIFCIGFFIASFILQTILTFVFLPIVPVDLWGFGKYLSMIPASALESSTIGFSSIIDYARMQISAMIAQFASGILLAPVLLLFYSFFSTGVYSELQKQNRVSSKQQPASFIGGIRK